MEKIKKGETVMRPIEFRAWDVELNHMVYDFHEMRDWECYWNEKRYIPMQYTGLLDKNGTKIFEGDIIDDGMGKTGIIRFGEWENDWSGGEYSGSSVIGFYLDNIDEHGARSCEPLTSDTMVDQYVYYRPKLIGNIYQSPELLK